MINAPLLLFVYCSGFVVDISIWCHCDLGWIEMIEMIVQGVTILQVLPSVTNLRGHAWRVKFCGPLSNTFMNFLFATLHCLIQNRYGCNLQPCLFWIQQCSPVHKSMAAQRAVCDWLWLCAIRSAACMWSWPDSQWLTIVCFEIPIVDQIVQVFAVSLTMQKMRRVQLRYAESEYFKVVCPAAKHQRVGSGLSVKYLIRFSPDIKKVS